MMVFKGLKVAFSALQPKADCTLTPKMSSFIHLQRRHAPYRRERSLLAKEGTITKKFSFRFFYMLQRWDMGQILSLPLRRKAC